MGFISTPAVDYIPAADATIRVDVRDENVVEWLHEYWLVPSRAAGAEYPIGERGA
jgi:hypothetical protein